MGEMFQEAFLMEEISYMKYFLDACVVEWRQNMKIPDKVTTEQLGAVFFIRACTTVSGN